MGSLFINHAHIHRALKQSPSCKGSRRGACRGLHFYVHPMDERVDDAVVWSPQELSFRVSTCSYLIMKQILMYMLWFVRAFVRACQPSLGPSDGQSVTTSPTRAESEEFITAYHRTHPGYCILKGAHMKVFFAGVRFWHLPIVTLEERSLCKGLTKHSSEWWLQRLYSASHTSVVPVVSERKAEPVPTVVVQTNLTTLSRGRVCTSSR
jgi:hypothetical protein